MLSKTDNDNKCPPNDLNAKPREKPASFSLTCPSCHQKPKSAIEKIEEIRMTGVLLKNVL